MGEAKRSFCTFSSTSVVLIKCRFQVLKSQGSRFSFVSTAAEIQRAEVEMTAPLKCYGITLLYNSAKKKGGKERTETPPEIQQRGKKGKRLGTGMCTSGDPWQLEEKEEEEEELLISPEMPEEGNIFAT